MPFYDNYFARSNTVSRMGRKIIALEVDNRIYLSRKLHHKNTLKTLELGPGKGHFARAVLSLGWEYKAIDGSPAVLEILGKENIDVIQAFVPPLPQETGDGYDLVLMEHFIEHLDSPASARNLVTDIHQRLSQGGLIFIVSPDFLAHRSNFWDCDYTHSFVTTIQRLRQLLLDCEFDVCYAGYETLGIQNSFVTWLVSEFTHVLYMTRLP